MSAAGWSGWQALPGWAPAPDVLAETLVGGQAFRWSRATDPADGETWTGVWSDHVVQLRLRDGALAWRAPRPIESRVAAALPRYLGVDVGWAARADALPWRSDTHLARCLTEFRGLQLLRQPFGETLLAFLCSATKRIVQIRAMLALLAERHGAPIAGSPGGVRRLPTWAELAAVPERDLRACQLGFRARHVRGTALFLAAHPGWLEETEAAPYAAARERLVGLPGVGGKVADCVLLFGAGRAEAFPVDTWILQALARHYGLDGWKPEQVARFGRAHFGPDAGFAQQFLFAWERRHPAARADQAADGRRTSRQGKK